ncbi:hypothetical protein MC885_010420 [Smutsia gigantea]|nr:hypothetical protein MC885_010420 [Smutsia gigantea]
MEKESPGFLENHKDPLAVDKIMKDLDQCRDGRVGFQSFFSLIAGLTIACNDYFVLHMKQKGKNPECLPSDSKNPFTACELTPAFPRELCSKPRQRSSTWQKSLCNGAHCVLHVFKRGVFLPIQPE